MTVENVSNSSFVPSKLHDNNTPESKAAALARQELESVGVQLSSGSSKAINVVPHKNAEMQIALTTITSDVSQDLFAFFETTYEKINSPKKCPSLDIFREDGPILEKLLGKWTLDSNLCFFDLLCLDIYADAKRMGVDPKELTSFCKHSNRLSVKLMEYSKSPFDPRAFSLMHMLFATAARTMGDKAPPTFKLLLKALTYPEQAVAIGISPVQWFGRNKVLDGKQTRREDVTAFLNFASEMHPNDLAFLQTIQSDAERSNRLCQLEKKLVMIQANPELRGDEQKQTERSDFYNRVVFLKTLIDKRLLQTQIDQIRLWCNLQMIELFNASPYQKWIEEVMGEYLGSFFTKRVSKIFEAFGKTPSKDTANSALISLANCYPPQPIDGLEQKIKKKLDLAKKKYKGQPENYSYIFCDLVRLYQIIHDLYAIRDVAQDQLRGRHFPDSFAERAFLQPIYLEEDASPEREASLPLPPQSLPAAEPAPPAPKLEEKKTPPSAVSIHTPVPAPAATQAPTLARPPAAPERPDFPRKNVSGQEVIRLLGRNNFLIRGISGSHYQMHHVESGVQTSVPFHGSIKRGTLGSIRNAYYRALGFEE